MDTKTNKELKEEYKQKKFKVGVFQLRNAATGKIFIGSSVNLDAMWNRIQMQLNYGNFHIEALQKDWKEYGADKFKYEILSEIEQKDDSADYAKEAKDLEKLFIDDLKPFGDKGYNAQ